MTMLVTLEAAKAHLRVTHDLENEDITLKIHAASAAVINYLKDTADLFLDSSGEVLMTADSPPVPDVPFVVAQATLLTLGWMFKNREGDVGVGGVNYTLGYLPLAVTSLLYPLRDPALQ